MTDEHDPFEDQVRATLREKAASVRPSSGGDAGLDAIQRKLAGESSPSPVRRSGAPWLAAAAAVVVIALVGGVLITRNDDEQDRTVVAGEGESADGAGPAPSPAADLLDAVWPTNDPDELLGISASYVRDPAETAAAYLSDRLDRQLTADLIELDGDTAQLTDGTPVVVHLGRHEQAWYVQSATSGLLDVALERTDDGYFITGTVTPGAPGDLTVLVGEVVSHQGFVDAERPVEVECDCDIRVAVRSTLVGDAGNVALDERLVLPVGWSAYEPTPAPASHGVWPKPVDEISGLTDPVDTAARYIEETAGASNGVVLSDFREGDSNSGEVEVTGDYVATIALRQVDGLWHVEAVHTPQVEARGDVPGELWLHANEAGLLSVTVLDAWGTVVQSMPGKHMTDGEEVVVVPAEPVHKPFTVRYRFEPSSGGGFGLGDVAVTGTHEQASTGEDEVHDVPDEAIFAAGGLDPIGTAQGYIEARLGFWPDGMHLDEGFSGEDAATVDWPYGSVFLVHHDGLWYVTESIGASVSFQSVDLPEVEVFLGEPGALRVQLLDAEGGVCAEASTDVEQRGAAHLTFEDIPCEVESVVAMMNEVIAEQAP